MKTVNATLILMRDGLATVKSLTAIPVGQLVMLETSLHGVHAQLLALSVGKLTELPQCLPAASSHPRESDFSVRMIADQGRGGTAEYYAGWTGLTQADATMIQGLVVGAMLFAVGK